ncbi:MAG TPA: TonB-dependent receptor, partial [Thermoanaerobaculia bacterium]
VDVQAGERGFANALVDGAIVSGAWNGSATIESRRDDGWDANDDFRQDAVSGGLSHGFGGGGSVGISARSTAYELGIPFNTSADGSQLVPSPSRRQEGRELQIAVPIRDHIGTLGYELTLSQSSRDDDFSDPNDPFGFTTATTESTTRRAQLTAKQATAFGTVIVGAEYEQAEVDDVSSYGVNLDDDRRTNRGLFVEDRASFSAGSSRVEIAAGLRYDDFDTFGHQSSPRVAAAWLHGAHKVHASYGEGFRAPSVGELYFPFSGNRDLEPEKSRSEELGYAWRSPNAAWDVTLFRSDFEDLIVFDNATFLFGNVKKASSEGVELSGRASLRAGLSAAIGYTYLHAEESGSGEPLLRRPRHSGSVRISYEDLRWGASLVVAHSGERDDLLPVFPYSRIITDGVTTVDATLALDRGRIRPYIKVENATNESYEEVAGYHAPGRRAIVGLRYTQ